MVKVDNTRLLLECNGVLLYLLLYFFKNVAHNRHAVSGAYIIGYVKKLEGKTTDTGIPISHYGVKRIRYALDLLVSKNILSKKILHRPNTVMLEGGDKILEFSGSARWEYCYGYTSSVDSVLRALERLSR
jgi:hypothetical protein